MRACPSFVLRGVSTLLRLPVPISIHSALETFRDYSQVIQIGSHRVAERWFNVYLSIPTYVTSNVQPEYYFKKYYFLRGVRVRYIRDNVISRIGQSTPMYLKADPTNRTQVGGLQHLREWLLTNCLLANSFGSLRENSDLSAGIDGAYVTLAVSTHMIHLHQPTYKQSIRVGKKWSTMLT